MEIPLHVWACILKAGRAGELLDAVETLVDLRVLSLQPAAFQLESGHVEGTREN